MTRASRILIVDDEPINLRLVSVSLGNDYEVVTALNGHEAISRLKEQQIDLILLDVMMPDISGFDVCKIIQANPDFVDIPVIFLTAMDTPQGARQGLAVGAIDYLTKPVDLELLKLRVRNLVSLKQRTDLVREQRDLLARQKEELEAALARVRQLEGIIPICMFCKKIKDDQESWRQLEDYVSQHSEVMFSHSACPECFEKEMNSIKEELSALGLPPDPGSKPAPP
ncbi:response regulator [Citrifermentans bemidjiense Bem]|uniref:Response regulator n=1 Tax=Citrifermentans bemidjiense (strain ATCC BAA-1014 / DSM 16622 / JCM 12645 / Bem) TaxID=404380 RepID=B5EES6_CITBB|nr:response regulator [Citrifermentans bemidjiense]ACH37822.1 response regulator [Citrifermentans bemidjiense Bem]